MKGGYEARRSQGQGSRGQSQESERGVSPVSPVLTVTGFDGGPRPILFTARTWNSYTVNGVNPREKKRKKQDENALLYTSACVVCLSLRPKAFYYPIAVQFQEAYLLLNNVSIHF